MSQTTDEPYALARAIREALNGRSIVLVGLMGAGKSAVGKRLAKRLELPFVDADTEIEAAAGKSISDIFAEHGEQHFRDGERRVIARLLAEGPQVLATGGGAFMDGETRARIEKSGVSLWLMADLDVLVRRVRKRNHRPLLRDRDPRKVLAELIEVRYPIYARADLTVHSRDVLHEVVVDEAVAALAQRLGLSEAGAG